MFTKDGSKPSLGFRETHDRIEDSDQEDSIDLPAAATGAPSRIALPLGDLKAKQMVAISSGRPPTRGP